MNRRGFTLIEVMLAVMLTAVILTPLVLILKTTIDAKITVETEIRTRKLGPTIMATISRDLRNAWATGPVDEVEIDGSWFKGRHNGGDDDAEDELAFVTSINSYMRYNGISSDLTEVGYYLKENETSGDNDSLEGLFSLYRREDFLVDKRPDEGGLGIKLHDRVVSFRVWYYDLPRSAIDEDGAIDPSALKELVQPGSADEKDDWDTDDDDRLPYAVRIELVLDATPIDAYNRKKKRRHAVYQTVVRMPAFPKLDDKFKLFNVQPPALPAAATPPPAGG
ncbi:MAG: prepilin-type N-terminal cleavage/methylation domain-containing protein, partial [Planctomycetes bacterium]|nr:prepilin-type N-terminal cleavage/methylation domain-containing protein [Planctomycetota bacterium]